MIAIVITIIVGIVVVLLSVSLPIYFYYFSNNGNNQDPILITQESYYNIPVSEESHHNIPVSEESYYNIPVSEESYYNIPVSEESYYNIPVSEENHHNIPVSSEIHHNIPISEESYYNNSTKTLCSNYIKNADVLNALNEPSGKIITGLKNIVCDDGEKIDDIDLTTYGAYLKPPNTTKLNDKFNKLYGNKDIVYNFNRETFDFWNNNSVFNIPNNCKNNNIKGYKKNSNGGYDIVCSENSSYERQCPNNSTLQNFTALKFDKTNSGNFVQDKFVENNFVKADAFVNMQCSDGTKLEDYYTSGNKTVYNMFGENNNNGPTAYPTRYKFNGVKINGDVCAAGTIPVGIDNNHFICSDMSGKVKSQAEIDFENKSKTMQQCANDRYVSDVLFIENGSDHGLYTMRCNMDYNLLDGYGSQNKQTGWMHGPNADLNGLILGKRAFLYDNTSGLNDIDYPPNIVVEPECIGKKLTGWKKNSDNTVNFLC